MAIIKTIKGDLIDLFKQGEFSAVAHGANCFSTMGSGIAWQIRGNFPEAYKADLEDARAPLTKLGSFSRAIVENGEVYNLYTQFEPGRNFEYSALKSSLEKLIFYLEAKQSISGLPITPIGIPLIGAGIGGGNWNVIKEIFEESPLEFIVVEYEKQRYKRCINCFSYWYIILFNEIGLGVFIISVFMRGCIDCKFHEGRITGFDENGKSLMEKYCIKGKNDEYVKWWTDNAHKSRDQIVSIMDCHEYHDTTKMLISMNEQADKILKLLNENKNQKD